MTPTSTRVAPKSRRRRTQRSQPSGAVQTVGIAGSADRVSFREPFPVRWFRKMVYAQSLTMGSSNVAYQLGTENVFRLNSCFDPDQTGGTHQPYGFDQMATLYDRYAVHAVTLDWMISTVPYSSGGATSILPIAAALLVQPSSATTSITGLTVSDVEEKNNGAVIWLEGTGRVSRFRQRFLLYNVEGISPLQMRANVEEYAAAVTANPTRSIQLRMAIANLATTAMVSVSARVRLEFEVEFFGRTTLAASN